MTKNEFLQDRQKKLTTLLAIVEDMQTGSSLSIASKSHGCAWNSVNNLLKSKALDNIFAEIQPLGKVVQLEPTPHEALYAAVFGEAAFRDAELPPDYRESVDAVLAQLTEREADILRKRYGIDDDILTLEEIGKIYGVTKDRIRQLEARGLRKLRHPSRMRLLAYGITRMEALEEWRVLEMQNAQDRERIALAHAKAERERLGAEISTMQKKPLLPIEAIEIEDMDLSVRSYTCLKRAGCKTLYDVMQIKDLTKVRNLGKKSMDEIKRAVTRTLTDAGYEPAEFFFEPAPYEAERSWSDG